MSADQTLNLTYPATPFDGIASRYDEEFENNPVTQHLRNFLWRRMLHYFKPGQKVLDLNCGTGTDAVFLAEHGINVTCIDSSSAMVRITMKKAEQIRLQNHISSQVMPIENVESFHPSTFDGAISNFGGLNCVNDLHNSFDDISKLIKPNGVLIACIMNKVCLWEIFSFLLRRKFKDAFRRIGNQTIDAPIGNGTVNVLYYTPQQVISAISKHFVIISVYGLNMFSPNPNSKRFITRYPKLTNTLLTLDEQIRYTFPFHSLGDHFVVEMKRIKS